MENKKQPGTGVGPEKSEYDTSTTDRVRRHFSDQHDEITGEDIRNVVPGEQTLNADDDGKKELDELGEEREKQSESRDKPSEGRVTPWDVIE
jgi:hypothetical protein